MSNFQGRLVRVAAAVLAVIGWGAVTPANASLIFYSDRASFDIANLGLPLEDFEAGQDAGPLTSTSFVGSLSASTDNDVFTPGDVIDGFTLIPIGSSGFVFAADGFRGLPTKHITSVLSNSQMVLLFDPDITAFGLDLLADPLTPGLFWEVQIFGSNASEPLGTLAVPNTVFRGETIPDSPIVFFGVDAEIIRKVVLVKPIGGDGWIDNMAFGTPSAVPLPAALPLFLSALAGLGLMGWRRRTA